MDFRIKRDGLQPIDLKLIEIVKNNPTLYNQTQQTQNQRASLFALIAIQLQKLFSQWHSITGT